MKQKILQIALTVCLLATNFAIAQTPKPPTFSGIVVGAAANGSSFNIVDKTGATITVPVTANTSIQANKVDVRFSEAIVFGMDVRGTLAPDGTAAQVTARGQADQLNVAQLQPFLRASDEEWALLKPRIDKVRALQRLADTRLSSGSNNGGNNQGNNGNGPPPQRNPAQELLQSLQSGFFNPSFPTPELKTTLDSLRQTKAQTRNELTTARNELRELITTRQEVLLVLMGILE